MARTRTVAAVLVVTGTLLFSACGSGDDRATGGGAPEASPTPTPDRPALAY